MDDKIFNAFRDLVYKKSGITISEGKIALVAARVAKRMRELQINDEEAYLDLVQSEKNEDEIVHLLDVISTNVTSFFREENHFEVLTKLLTEWKEAGAKKFRIWCAAASSGEEPYTLAMTLSEVIANTSIDAKILATDISTRVLAKCQNGVYNKDKVESIPAELLKRYFTPVKQVSGTVFSANDSLRSLINFTRLNLSETPFPMHGPFDAIFCRNVMIYFDNTVRKKLLEEAYRLLKPGGYLFVGHAESLTGILSGFKAVKPSVYIK